MFFSNWMVLALAAVLTLRSTSSLRVGKVKPAKVKKPKPIDWNNTYYAEKFRPCKKLQMFNPVERVRAQAWATGFYRKCGPKLVVKYATKFNFPAYGLVRMIDFGCWYFTVLYSFIANDGGSVIPNNIQTSVYFNLSALLLGSFRKSNLTVVIKHSRREKFTVTSNMIAEYMSALGRCAYEDSPYMYPLDNDYAKHVAEHFKVLLL